MMWQAQTPQGIITWLSDTDEPLVGSPIVAYRLREASTTGIRPFIPCDTVQIDLSNPGDVRFALEVFYPDEVTFDENTPPATEFFEPFETGLIY
jgi:hypothetical protein